MGKLGSRARMTIEELAARGVNHCAIARTLDVTEGTVRYHLRRRQEGAEDGRARQEPRAAAWQEPIADWMAGCARETDGAVNLAALHDWLVEECSYRGSLRSLQRYVAARFGRPKLRARRRVETPPGAQAQVDWAHFPAVIVGGAAVDLVALHMVLSWSRQEAIVWARSKDMLAGSGCNTDCFVRLGLR